MRLREIDLINTATAIQKLFVEQIGQPEADKAGVTGELAEKLQKATGAFSGAQTNPAPRSSMAPAPPARSKPSSPA